MLPPPAGVLKLDQNEVPIPPPQHVLDAARQALAVANCTSRRGCMRR